jgi:hypothetical protein
MDGPRPPVGMGAPRWSPTGEWIAYTDGTMYSYPTCGGGVRCPITPLLWVFAQALRIVRPDGSETRTLLPGGLDRCTAPCLNVGHHFTAAVGGTADPGPAAVGWSPDGEWLIGKAWYPDLRITLIRVSTGERLPLNGSTAAFSMPAWKP